MTYIIRQRCALSKLADNINLRGATDTPDGCATIQKDLNRMEKWTNRNLVKFNKGKYQVLHLGRNNPRHQYRLGNRSPERDLGVLMKKLTMRQQCTPAAKQADSLQGCVRQSTASRLREVTLSLY